MAWLGRAKWLGGKVFDGIEWVGEMVVSVLGLDDSRYQDILDNMTPREMQMAENVHAERQEEYRIHSENTSVGVLVESGGVAAVPPPGSLPHAPTAEKDESETVVDIAAVQIVEEQQEEQGEDHQQRVSADFSSQAHDVSSTIVGREVGHESAV